MPIRHAVMHFIDKKPDGSPAVLHLASDSLPDSGAVESLLHDVNALGKRINSQATNATIRPNTASQRNGLLSNPPVKRV